MILNCGATAAASMVLPWRSQRRTKCLASSIDTGQLRTQLDQLHLEAEKTRAKANKARLRLKRLSEAAEKLQRQAIISVQTGKENDARELLFQKKKALQALEKSKSRIELLDELSAKLNEAISVRETQLVGTVGLDLQIDKEDSSTPVRIVTPREERTENSGNIGDPDSDLLKFSKDDDLQDQADLPTNNGPNNLEESLQVYAQGLAKLPAEVEQDNLEGSFIGFSSLKGISSYEDFLEHVDQQLKNIEAELVTVVRFSTLILEGEERPKNLKVHQTVEILVAVRRIRGRIAVIMHNQVEIR